MLPLLWLYFASTKQQSHTQSIRNFLNHKKSISLGQHRKCFLRQRFAFFSSERRKGWFRQFVLKHRSFLSLELECPIPQNIRRFFVAGSFYFSNLERLESFISRNIRKCARWLFLQSITLLFDSLLNMPQFLNMPWF